MTNWQNPSFFQLPITFQGFSIGEEKSPGFSAAKHPTMFEVLAAGLAVDKCYFFRVLSAWVDSDGET